MLKTKPLGAAHTYIAYMRELPPLSTATHFVRSIHQFCNTYLYPETGSSQFTKTFCKKWKFWKPCFSRCRSEWKFVLPFFIICFILFSRLSAFLSMPNFTLYVTKVEHSLPRRKHLTIFSKTFICKWSTTDYNVLRWTYMLYAGIRRGQTTLFRSCIKFCCDQRTQKRT